MRTQKVSPGNVDQQLYGVFSEFGYDGASMEVLSRATGLKKASLYHRFPKGKKEMACHVLNIVESWIKENIVAVLADEELKRETRLKKAITSIDKLYDGGANNCLLRTLSLGSDADVFNKQITRSLGLLEDSFTTFSIGFGSSPASARQKAKHVNLLIQGSLVLAGATKDKSYFRNALAEISNFMKTGT